jgi:hypothetical protein
MIHHSLNKISCSLKADTAVECTINYVEFKVLAAVVMKSNTFWDITPCSPLKGTLHNIVEDLCPRMNMRYLIFKIRDTIYR